MSWNRICYTLWAPFYDGAGKAFEKNRRRSIEILAPRPKDRVLLLGAGTGSDLDHLPPGLHVTAVDAVPGMVRRIDRRARRLGMAVDARVMDARDLEFPDGSFDAVVLHLILAVVDHPEQCAREVARVLRPGGKAVVLDKFWEDSRRVPRFAIALNPLTRLFGTSVNRRLGPILESTDLVRIHEEPAKLRGFFKIVLLERPQAPR